MARAFVNIYDQEGNQIDEVPMGQNGVTGAQTNNEYQKVYRAYDEKGNPYYTSTMPESSASITLDKDTGKINISAPQEILDDSSFGEVFNTNIFKQLSSAYKRNQDYKLADPFAEGDESKDITIPELIEKYNEEIKKFVTALNEEKQNRQDIAAGRRGFSNRNDIANRLTRNDMIIMGTNALGEGANDDSLISIPKSMYGDVNFLDSFDDVAGTVKKGEFLEKVFSLKEHNEDYVNSIYNRLEEYFDEDEFEDTEEYARASALYGFILANDPGKNPLQEANYVVSNFFKGLGYSLNRGIGEAAEVFLGASPEYLEKDYADDQAYIDEAEKFISRMSSAGATALNVGKIGGDVAAIIPPAVVTGGASGALAEAGVAAATIGGAIRTAKKTEATVASIAATAEDLTAGADILISANSVAKAAEIGERAAKLARVASGTGTAVDLAAQSIVEAVISDPVVFAKILQNQESAGQQAMTREDAYGTLLETAAWNIGGWGLFTVGAKGMKYFSTSRAGRYTNAIAQKYLNKVSVKTGAIGEKLLRVRYGENWLEGSRSSRVNQARKYNYEVREAQKAIADQKIGTVFNKNVGKNVRQQEENIIKLMQVHNATDAVQRGAKAYIGRMLNPKINPTLSGYEQKLRKLGAGITRLERRAGLSTRRKVFRTRDNSVVRVFSKQSANYLGAKTELAVLENIQRVRGGLTEAQLKGKEILERKLAEATKALPKEIRESLDAYLAWDRKFYAEYNNIRMREGSLNAKQIEELRAEGYWGENGELYRPAYRVDPDKETKLVRNDERIARNNDTATEQYVWGSGKDFMDPEIARYMYMEDAGSTFNATRYIEAINSIPSSKAHVVHDAEEVARAQRMKDIRKPLGARIKTATYGIFKTGAIATGESSKRASRLQKMRAAYIKQQGETIDSELALSRASRSKIRTTVSERRTAIDAMSRNQVDEVLSSAGIDFNFSRMNSSEEFEAFYNSLDKGTQEVLQQRMRNVAGILYPAETTSRLDAAIGRSRAASLIMENGKPKMFYHGSPNKNIDQFDISLAGSRSRSGEKAIFFTDDADTALNEFSYERTPTNSSFVDNRGEQGRVYERFLNMKKPLDLGKLSDKQISDLWKYVDNRVSFDGKEAFVRRIKEFRKSGNDQLIKGQLDLSKLKDSEYDGLIARMYPGENNIKEYAVFDTANIVSPELVSDYSPLVKNAPYITAENYNKLAKSDPSFVPSIKKSLSQGRKDLRDSSIVAKAAEDAKRAKLVAEREGLYKENLAELERLGKVGKKANDQEAILREFDEGIDEYIEEVYKDKKLSQTIDDIIEQSGTKDKEAAREYIVLEEMLRDDTQELRELRQVARDELKNDVGAQKASDLFERTFEDKIVDRRNIARQKLVDENSTLVDRKSWMEEIRKLDKEITGAMSEPGYVSIPNSRGEMEVWEVDPIAADLYKYSARQPDMNAIAKFFNTTSKVFRLGTTGLNLMSFVNQSFRDFGNLWLTSGSYRLVNLSRAEMVNQMGQEIAEHYLREEPEIYAQLLKQAERQGKTVERAAVERELAIGAETSTQATETALLKTVGDAKTVNKINKGEMSIANTWLDRAVDVLSTPNEWRERYSRNVVYSDSLDQALKRGYSLKSARTQAEFMMNNATTNFSRQLVHLQSLQRTVPYIGAAVNGTKSFFRILSVDPVGVMSRFVGGFVIPIMAFTGLALADPRAKKKYEQLSEYEKDNNIIINIDGSLMKIPIPQEVGPLVKPWQHLVEKIHDSNRHDFWELMLNDALGISPMDITGFYDLDQDAMENPTIWDRLDNGATQLVWGQIAPVPMKAAYMAATGKDPYTGKFVDTSYQYYDPESGDVTIMDSSQSAFAQAMANAFGGPAGIISAVTTALLGRTGTDVLDSLTSAIQYGVTGGGEGSLTTILERAGESISKPITVAEYDRTRTAWNREISALYREKEEIQNSEKYKKIEETLNIETDPDKIKKLKAQRQDMLDPWYEKTKVAINKLQDNFGGTIDRYRMASLLSLLNMHENSGGIGPVGRAANEELYYEGRDEATRALISMGADETGDGSILGYMTTVRHNDGTETTEVKFYKPLEILAMQNAWHSNASVSKAYVQELLEDGDIDYTQELKQVKKLRQQIYDKGKLSQADYANITALELEWNARVMTALAPYIERVSPESAINDEEVMEYLDDIILVPSEFKKDKRGRYVTNKSLGAGSANDAYIKNYIRKIFEVNDTGYSTGKNYSGRQTLGG